MSLTVHISLYLFFLIAAFFLSIKFSKPGAWRIFAVSTWFAWFFSVGVIGGHGIMPWPASAVVVMSIFDSGMSDHLALNAILLAAQWAIVLVIAFSVFGLVQWMKPRA